MAPAVALPFRNPSRDATPGRCRLVSVTCTTRGSYIVSSTLETARAVFDIGPLFPTELGCFNTTIADSAVDRESPVSPLEPKECSSSATENTCLGNMEDGSRFGESVDHGSQNLRTSFRWDSMEDFQKLCCCGTV
ncbi:hypothetical protein QJS10_CPA01g01770 [Acorus calamus]|uniref:Uncharacterized protein n=1 Tax=Acorus calamus TaxID=4465 RepID=A0AAV9FE45_ACOCL|nr:hypothetical protein QJS10_CPA01g01770 [Acorus calamus]